VPLQRNRDSDGTVRYARSKRAAAGLALAALPLGLAIRYCPVPWSAVLLTCALVLMVALIVRRHTNRAITQMVIANAAAALLALSMFEAYLGVQKVQGDGTRIEGSVTEGYTVSDDLLGYAPKKSGRYTARKYYGNTLLYDVAYTIGKDGLRISPPSSETIGGGCIIFFADSTIFGEGLNDDQTLPFYVGQKTRDHPAIYNFAFIGYGPHQMLASLQAGRLTQIVRCAPTNFVYRLLPEHAARVAGLASWDKHGPRFVLDARGGVVRRGHFDDLPLLVDDVPRAVEAALARFFIWQRFFGRTRDTGPADVDLLAGVVAESARLTKRLYPDSFFHVLLGNDHNALIEPKLTAAGISIVKVSSIIPDLAADWSGSQPIGTRYMLSVHDFHPNALQNELIADYLVQKLFNRP
jgi:hypothetical protein